MHLLDNYHPRAGYFLEFRATRGHGGLGDRVVGIVSALVLAILTQRHFRIDWQTPFPLASVWQPGDERLAWNASDHEHGAPVVLSAVDQAWKFAQPMSMDLLDPPCGTLVIEANQHFFTYLFEQPFLKRAADGPRRLDPAEIFGQALQGLFRPTPALRDALAEPARRLTGRNTIGLQVRTLWNWRDGGGSLQTEELAHFFDCADSLLTGRDDDLIFVSSDDAAIASAARTRFDGVEVWSLPNPILHVDRSAWDSLEDYRATFMNVHLLARCRHLVISHWSNFGRLAALWSGNQPWITRKSGLGGMSPQVGERFRRARLGELLSKEEALVTARGERARRS